MPHHAHNVIPINLHRRSETAARLRALAEAAERGDITGVGYVVIDANGQTHQGLVGEAEHNLAAAHYGLAQLMDVLLRPDRYRKRR
ncbi:hypothetical protein [Thauera phenylacetica]|uniref:hypothetical protein n=1 Tax=Thauera phenylacetica TaxID=164400 RepID=UPI0039E64723